MNDNKAAPTASPGTEAGTDARAPRPAVSPPLQRSGEIGGPPGPEPTRYGDWESKGRCTDF
ncbi:MAG TPA: DUF1674 domain-containing protein [Arenibaculum sp.]|nr:DUF1674 domain-containing protein [Arenibaculum sp.]